jgi:antitoxin (DNA-binding transcriptional repressor) of toxin-antitoxin stability system
MNQETIPISKFRANLRKCCHAVKLGKKELIVTYHGTPFFKVSKAALEENLAEVSLAFNREHMTEFIDLIEKKSAVILTAHGRKLVKCELI